MATLANLFVTYENVRPTKSEKRETEESSADLQLAQLQAELQAAKDRIALLENDSQRVDPISDDEESQDDGDEELDVQNSLGEKAGSHDYIAPRHRAGHTSSSSVSSNSLGSEDEELGIEYGVDYDRGELEKELSELFSANNINAKITCGKDPNRSNKNSHHITGDAVDIIPDGVSFDDLKNELLGSSEIRTFFMDNGLGVFDETPENSSKGRTGPHFHIGPDKVAKRGWKKWLKEYGDFEAPDETGSEDEMELTSNEKSNIQLIYDSFLDQLNKRDVQGRENGSAIRTASQDTYRQWAKYLTAQWATDNGFSNINSLTYYYPKEDPSGFTSMQTNKKKSRKVTVHKLEDYTPIVTLMAAHYGYMNDPDTDRIPGNMLATRNISYSNDEYKKYHDDFFKNLNLIDKCLTPTHQYGGVFAKIRNLYGKSFS